MMRILLVGGGIAAERYVESLIWTDNEVAIAGFNYLGKSKRLSEKYLIPYYDFISIDKKTLNMFEILIVCVPVEIKYSVIHRLVYEMEYRGRMILEKPFSIGIENIEKLYEVVQCLDCCIVACQRDFDMENYKINNQETYDIVWYSIKEKLYDNIIHMMPHLLSWMIVQMNCYDIDIHVDDNRIVGKIGKSAINIRFVKSEDNYIVINERSYYSPNYRKINAIIVEKVSFWSKHQTNMNLNRAVLVSKIISTLVSEIQGGIIDGCLQ